MFWHRFMSSLDTLRPGHTAIISELDGADEAARRLMELGLLPGERIELIGRAPLGDPLAVLIRGTRVALRMRDARRIRIHMPAWRHRSNVPLRRPPPATFPPMPSAAPAAAGSRVLKVACVGNPNTGKSTLFNALAGLHARVGNYPGVTVEKKIGRVHWGEHTVDLVDLPGTYSISPRSADEMVAVDVLLGRHPDVGPIDVVLCIIDAAHLERNLFLTSQLLELGAPVVLVLNMWDAAHRGGMTIDTALLEQRLGVPVVVTEGHRRKGIDGIREAVLRAAEQSVPQAPDVYPAAFLDESRALATLIAGAPGNRACLRARALAARRRRVHRTPLRPAARR